MATISSRQHALVTLCRTIVRGGDSRLLLDGWHLLHDALDAGLTPEWVAVDASRASDAATIARARATGASVIDVTSSVMDAMSPVRAASGVVAVCARPEVDPASILAPPPSLALVAFGLQDPGNAGALVRSADAAGATGVLLDAHSADPWGWKALRAAMGSTFRLPVCRDAAALHTLRQWQRHGVTLVAADPHAGIDMYDADLRQPLALVLGAEGAGLPAETLALADQRVRVPMRPRVESLNVAVAAAVLAYEAARQRGARA